MFDQALGIARRIRFELEIGPRLIDQHREPADIDQPGGLEHESMIEVKLVAQQRFAGGIEALLHLQQDQLAPASPLDRSAEIADEVFCVLLDIKVTVA